MMQPCRIAVALAGLSATILAPGTACADSLDVGAGLARAVGMGGARVALQDQTDPTVNPAMLGSSHGLHVASGGLEVGTQGITLSDLESNFNKLTKSTSGSDQAINIAETFANRTNPLILSYDVHFGLGYGPVLISAVGQARADAGQFYGNPSTFGAADTMATTTNGLSNYYQVYTGYAYGPEVSFGHAIRNPVNRSWGPLQAGINVRFLNSTTQAFLVSTPRDANGNIDTTAIANNGQLKTYNGAKMTGNGVGVDFGLLMGVGKKLTAGLTVENAVSPDLPGISTQTVLNTGVAVQFNDKLLVAADLDNLTNAYNEGVTPRVGAEYRLVKLLAVRAGASSHGVAVGVGVAGINLAYSSDGQRLVSEQLHF